MARKSAADLKLQKISQILFPETKVFERVEDGEKIKYMVDYSIDNNLYAVLIDLQEGNNDQACQNTINKCIEALNKVRDILEASMYLEKDARYIMVDMIEDKNVEDI